MSLDHLIDGSDRQSRLTLRAPVAHVEPVPETLGVGEPILLWVQHKESIALGDRVHLRTFGERQGILTATVQHHHQWRATMSAETWRNEEVAAEQSNQESSLHRYPIIRAGESYILALPGAVTYAVRRLIVGVAAERGLLGALRLAPPRRGSTMERIAESIHLAIPSASNLARVA